MNKQILRSSIFIGLFLVPFVPFLVSSSFFFPFITTKAFTWRVVVEIIFAAWLILAFLDAEYRPKKSHILYAIFGFIGIIGLANLFGADPAISFWSNFERMEGYLTILHLGMYFAVISSVFNEIHWKRWWNTSLVAAFLMVLYCLLQLAGLKTINQGGVRVDGTLGNATYLAVYMLFHIFVAALFLWREKKNAALAWIYGLLILSYTWVLYYTATRGAILGLLGGILVVAILNVRNKENPQIRKASIGALAALVVLVGGFFAIRDAAFIKNSPVLSRFSTLSLSEIKSQGRYFIWPMAIEGVKERPILGWGQENFSYIFQKYYDPRMYELEPWFDRAHNIFLDWAVAGGVLGLLAYLSLYGALFYLTWTRANFSYAEKSLLTGLALSYFFHSFFVFDHLISYILFFSLLAYIHHRSAGEPLWHKTFEQARVTAVFAPIAIILLALSIYFVNVKPMRTNTALIGALRSLQAAETIGAAPNYFKQAYRSSRLGRTEAVEQASYNMEALVNSGISNAEKSEFVDFVKSMVEKNAEDAGLARAQITAGSFFFKIGSPDEALKYLLKAEELSPGKQPIKFEIAEAYLYKGDYRKALEVARSAYELEPKYGEAQFTYAVAAIYAGDRELENQMKNRIYQGDAELEAMAKKSGDSLDLERWVESDLIALAYVKVGRHDDAIELLKQRLEREPAGLQNYLSLASVYFETGNKTAAIQTLRLLAEALPEYKDQAESYIEQITKGGI